jgi:hypothetical protein
MVAVMADDEGDDKSDLVRNDVGKWRLVKPIVFNGGTVAPTPRARR